MRTAVALVVLSAGGAAVVAALAGCPSGPEPCTPDNAGLGGAPRVTARALTGRPATSDVPCNPHTEVLHDDDALHAMYGRYGVKDSDIDASMPVDWSKESVVVIEAKAEEGVSWAVVQGDVATFGLLGCQGVANGYCQVDVVAVPGNVASAATHECDPVGCSTPSNR